MMNKNNIELNIYPVKKYKRNEAYTQLQLNLLRNYIQNYLNRIFIRAFKEKTKLLNRIEIKYGIMKNKELLLAYKLSKIPVLIGKIKMDISPLRLRINVPISSVKPEIK